MSIPTPPDRFQFTKDASGQIRYFDMAGNPIAPPPADTKVRVLDHDPRILPLQHKTQGKTGLQKISRLTKNRIIIR
jgi:hypothetical protein